MNSPSSVKTQRAWHGDIALHCIPRFGQTAISAKHQGPLRVQRAFYPETDGTAHLYLLHPPGGMVEGDQMRVDVSCESGAQVLVTTPGAGKFYRSVNHPALWSQTLRVQNSAALEWLPQETIIFDAANAHLQTHIDLESDARFIGWDVVCFGRGASREPFARGEFDSRLALSIDNKPCVNERLRFDNPAVDIAQPWLLRGATVSGNLFAYPADSGLVDSIRALTMPEHAMTGTTLLRDGVVACRYLGHDGAQAMHWMREVWGIARPHVMKKKAIAPRIWST